MKRTTPKKKDMTRKERAEAFDMALERDYSEAFSALDFNDGWECLVATILSAQCTDKRVNQITPALFEAFPTIESFAKADAKALEPYIHSAGFFRSKANHIIGSARSVIQQFNGKVPSDFESLLTLPGVGRKTANCIRVNVFHLPGLMCDTHFCRLTKRMDLHDEDDPEKIEYAVGALLPEARWSLFGHRVILHGRAICHARNPKCPDCSMKDFCPSSTLSTDKKTLKSNY